MKQDTGVYAALMGIICLAVTTIAAWLTHVIVCINTAKYVFLIAGGLCAPVGVIHGVGVWFGFWN